MTTTIETTIERKRLIRVIESALIELNDSTEQMEKKPMTHSWLYKIAHMLPEVKKIRLLKKKNEEWKRLQSLLESVSTETILIDINYMIELEQFSNRTVEKRKSKGPIARVV